jgi:NodT family efflux transporter outer membrane factor (OMF) lipoprotein
LTTLMQQHRLTPTGTMASTERFCVQIPGRRVSRSCLFVGLMMVGAAGGCTVGPDFSAPAAPPERSYTAQSVSMVASAGARAEQQRVDMGGKLQTDWWTLLRSPELDQTVELALSNNKTVDIARANLAKATEEVTAARGALYPQVDAAGSLGRQKYGAQFLGPLASSFPAFSAYSAGVTVSYDLDVFGGNRRRIELAGADSDVQREALNAANLDVAGNTVMGALQTASIRDQIAVLGKVIASDEQNLRLVRTANLGGTATQIDVATAQSQLDHDHALLPPLQQQLAAAQDALATLVGRSPATWAAPEFSLARMSLPENIPLVVPSELVRARPDIRAAEAQLHAASAAVGIATADLYPRITLSAAVAEQGLFGGPAGAAWSLLGGLTAPIFHGGALSAARRAAVDAYQGAFAQYQQAVLDAFRQVADNLHGLSTSADAVKTERQALSSADAALRLTRLGYAAGDAGLIQVLDAQRLQQLAELSLVQARANRYIQTVNLFLAVGGGVADGTQRMAGRSPSR